MDTERERAQRRIPQLLEHLDQSPLGQRLRETGSRRRMIYEALSRHPDPVLREIGRQVVDGQMRPADILRVPAYADAFREAATRAADGLDPEVVARGLERMVNSPEGRPEHGGEPR